MERRSLQCKWENGIPAPSAIQTFRLDLWVSKCLHWKIKSQKEKVTQEEQKFTQSTNFWKFPSNYGQHWRKQLCIYQLIFVSFISPHISLPDILYNKKG